MLITLSGQGEPLDALPSATPTLNSIIGFANPGSVPLYQTPYSAFVALNPPNVGFEALGFVPSASQIIGAVSFPTAYTFPGNFAGSTGAIVGTNPAASFVATINKNGSPVGTMTISTSGAYTFATTDGDPIEVSPGDVLTFAAPASPDIQASGFVWSITGVPTPS